MRSSRTVAALASDWRPDSAIRGVIFTDTRNAECGDMHHLPAAYPWHALTSVPVSVIETSYALPVRVRSTGWRRYRPDSLCSRSQWLHEGRGARSRAGAYLSSNRAAISLG